MAVIAVVALKGGVGKTTTAVYLSLVMATAGQRVVLADADRQTSALRWADEAGGLGDSVLTVGATTPEALRGLRELAAGAEVVIDTPPGDLRLVRAALSRADVALIPVRPTMLDLDRLGETLDEVANAAVPGVILLTQVRSRTRSLASARSALDELGLPLLDTVIPAREAIAASFGDAPDPEGLDTYRQALAELQAALTTTTEAP
jgi:chromosome partitioning protein